MDAVLVGFSERGLQQIGVVLHEDGAYGRVAQQDGATWPARYGSAERTPNAGIVAPVTTGFSGRHQAGGPETER